MLDEQAVDTIGALGPQSFGGDVACFVEIEYVQKLAMNSGLDLLQP